LCATAHKIHSFYYFFDGFEKKEGAACSSGAAFLFFKTIDSGIKTLIDEIPGF